MAPRLAVVGGGWAGVAAAVEATLRGHVVTLYEMSAQLGGRARRVDIDGVPCDNGQHILIGAYRETLRMMRTVGVDASDAFLRTPLDLRTPEGVGLALPSGAPLVSFVRGVLGASAWPLRDRLGLLCGASAWGLRGFRCGAGTTVAELTASLPAAIRSDLVDPLCVAALNTPARDASASVFLRVLRDALFTGRGSADLLLPRRPLSDLLPEPAARWLRAAGAELRLSSRVEQLQRADGSWLVDGKPYDRVVLASTAVVAARLVRPIAGDWADIAAALGYEPIVTVYALAEGAKLPQPMLALRANDADSPAQFVFDRGQLDGEPGWLAFVVSGAQPWLARGADALGDATIQQGERALRPHLRGPLRALRTLIDKRATFRCTPGLRRPSMCIAAGLHAAGDYVEGQYPATLEGAVASAVRAVRAFSGGRMGRPAARR